MIINCYHAADCGVPLVNRNLKLNLISTLEGSVLTLTCENEMSLNFTNETTLSVTCDSNGSWIPNPADFIQSCSPFSTTVSPTTGTNKRCTVYIYNTLNNLYCGLLMSSLKYRILWSILFKLMKEDIIHFPQMQKPQ